MAKELSLNILEIARKVQKMEESYPASKVIMTGGGNVEYELGTYSETTLSITGFNSSFQFQRIGKIAFITYNGEASNLPKGALSFTETIPLAYRPKMQTRIYSVDTSESGDSTVVMLVLNTNGSISGYRYGSAITAATQCRFGTISYIAAN